MSGSGPGSESDLEPGGHLGIPIQGLELAELVEGQEVVPAVDVGLPLVGVHGLFQVPGLDVVGGLGESGDQLAPAVPPGGAAGVLKTEAGKHHSVDVLRKDTVAAQGLKEMTGGHSVGVAHLRRELLAMATVDQEVAPARADEKAVEPKAHAVAPVRGKPVLPLPLWHLPKDHAPVHLYRSVGYKANGGPPGHDKPPLTP